MAISDIDKRYIQEYIKRSISIQKAIEGNTDLIASKLTLIHAKVLDEIKKKYPTINSKNLAILSENTKELLLSYNSENIYPSVKSVVEDLITKEIQWVANGLTLYTTGTGIPANKTSVYKKALKKTYQGHTFNYWFNGVSKESGLKVEKLLRSGYTTGLTTEEVVKNVASALNKSKSDVRTLTRSFLQHASRESRDETYDKNLDLVSGYYWFSTLDGRTTVNICGIRDGKFYDKDKNPVGHSLPWDDGPGRIHFNCRSTYLTQLIGQDDIFSEFDRSSVIPGENYEKGDLKTNRGKVRKPTKYNRDNGKLALKKQPNGIDYEGYIRKQNLTYIEDVIGKKYAKEFKAGNISLLQVVNKTATADEINKL